MRYSNCDWSGYYGEYVQKGFLKIQGENRKTLRVCRSRGDEHQSQEIDFSLTSRFFGLIFLEEFEMVSCVGDCFGDGDCFVVDGEPVCQCSTDDKFGSYCQYGKS